MGLKENISKNFSTWKKKRATEKERDAQLKIKVNKAKRTQYEKGKIARAKDDGWKEGIGVKPRSNLVGRLKQAGSTLANMSESFADDFLIDSGFTQKPKPHRKTKPKNKRRNKPKKRNKKTNRKKKKDNFIDLLSL